MAGLWSDSNRLSQIGQRSWGMGRSRTTGGRLPGKANGPNLYFGLAFDWHWPVLLHLLSPQAGGAALDLSAAAAFLYDSLR